LRVGDRNEEFVLIEEIKKLINNLTKRFCGEASFIAASSSYLLNLESLER